MRPGLCEDALRLGRILAELAPREPEVHGLVALMEIQASRAARPPRPDRRADPAARSGSRRGGITSSSGAGWPRWSAPSRWAARADRTRCRPRSPPATRAPARAAETDWARIVGLYGALAELTPSPIIELNRAVALAMHMGPAAGLAIVDELRDEPALARYHLLPSVRGDLLMKLGRRDEARAEFERAASLTQNARERALLLDRAAACARKDGKSDA